ncbi:MAG: hypothetical protein H0W72_17665 [Planctomycetes bacterium]|nr:hypothetical protein [Planctomycetota bacterium]
MATAADAELILRLYDLRREAVCREARSFFMNWKPKDEAEVKAALTMSSNQDNAYIRQSTSYWEMAFSLANSGAIDQDLFAKNCGEGLIFCLKCQHLAKQFPGVWNRMMVEAETFLAKSAIAQKKAELFKARFG